MSISTVPILPDIGVKVRWIGDSLQVSPPLERLSEAQSLAVAAYKASVLEKKRAEESALFEIGLEYARQFASEAFHFLGGFKHVHVPGLHTSYGESLARIMRGLAAPIGLHAFGELLNDAERQAERQAMQATDNATENTIETSLQE